MFNPAEMPLVARLLSTVQAVGYDATNKALINACNKSVSIDDPKVQAVINAVLQEMAISFEQLITRSSRLNKKRYGLIVVSYCLTSLNYSHAKIGIILGGRSRQQISRYHNMLAQAKSVGKLAQYRKQFDLLIKKIKKKQNLS